MSAHDHFIAALEAVVGAEWLLTGTATADYAVDGVTPSLVVFPADEAQVGAVLRLSDEHQAAVIPRGGGSHSGLGNVPKRVDVVLSVQRLQQQLAYEPGDMTTTVQAGLRLADLQASLHPHGQFLALDPSAADTTTMGGIVAANLSGPRRLLYGSARDLLLGSAVISLDGKRTKAGGRVVKNVTGYDLNKLYIGSLGTLAVIVELTWKVHPKPPGEQTLGIGVTQGADLADIRHMLVRLPLRLNSLVLLNRAAAAALAAQTGVASPDTPYLFLARLEGTPEVVEHQTACLATALRDLALAGAASMHTWQDDEPTRLWQGVEALPLTQAQAAPHGIVGKVSLRLAAIPAFIEAMATAAEASGTPWPLLAHAGHGVVYVRLTSGGTVEDLMPHLHTLDACVARLQGRRVLEYAPLAIKRQIDVWGATGDDFALMRGIKATFDPHSRLNPGRFLGGL
jgi:glycolate oxidase FAD binding subunit